MNDLLEEKAGPDLHIIVNGQPFEVPEWCNIEWLLEMKDVKDAKQVTVQLNGKPLESILYVQTPIMEGDVIEFLYFMGGGNG